MSSRFESGFGPSATLMLVPPSAVKGRGTVWAIEHRFNEHSRSEFDDGWGTLEQAALEERQAPGTQVLEEDVRGILSGNDSPDIGFDLSINPYRGCEHVLLCAAHTQLPQSLSRARLRDPDHRQGQRGRPAA
jgi:hypothetical protein